MHLVDVVVLAGKMSETVDRINMGRFFLLLALLIDVEVQRCCAATTYKPDVLRNR